MERINNIFSNAEGVTLFSTNRSMECDKTKNSEENEKILHRERKFGEIISIHLLLSHFSGV